MHFPHFLKILGLARNAGFGKKKKCYDQMVIKLWLSKLFISSLWRIQYPCSIEESTWPQPGKIFSLFLVRETIMPPALDCYRQVVTWVLWITSAPSSAPYLNGILYPVYKEGLAFQLWSEPSWDALHR